MAMLPLCVQCAWTSEGQCKRCNKFRTGDLVHWPILDDGYGVFIMAVAPRQPLMPTGYAGPDAMIFDRTLNQEVRIPMPYLKRFTQKFENTKPEERRHDRNENPPEKV